MVQAVGGGQSGGTTTDHGYPFAIAHRLDRLDIALAEGSLHDSGLVLADGDRLVAAQLQHATLLAECRANTSGKLWKVVGLRQDMIGIFVAPFV